MNYFNVFRYDAVSGRDSNLSTPQQRRTKYRRANVLGETKSVMCDVIKIPIKRKDEGEVGIKEMDLDVFL